MKALKNETGLGGYEIINEPEGSVSISSNSEPCFDTKFSFFFFLFFFFLIFQDVKLFLLLLLLCYRSLSGTGAGWTGSNIQMKDLQMFGKYKYLFQKE